MAKLGSASIGDVGGFLDGMCFCLWKWMWIEGAIYRHDLCVDADKLALLPS
jgi:hypothetical protein